VLRWDGGDVDIEHGVLSITRAYNRNAKRIDSTKSGETRRFPLGRTCCLSFERCARRSAAKVW
jgi:hypothetical protein